MHDQVGIVDSRREPSFRLARRFTLFMGDGQEKGKKKATDGRHDGKNPDVFNGPPGSLKFCLLTGIYSFNLLLFFSSLFSIPAFFFWTNFLFPFGLRLLEYETGSNALMPLKIEMRRILIGGNGVPQIDASQVNVHKKVENLRQERKEFVFTSRFCFLFLKSWGYLIQPRAGLL